MALACLNHKENEVQDLARAVSRGIQRRMRARLLYRKRRDRKIAVDYIGREFEVRYTRPLDGVYEWLPMQLVGYDPERATIKFRLQTTHGTNSITWSTDDFWSQYRTGTLRDK